VNLGAITAYPFAIGYRSAVEPGSLAGIAAAAGA
jgi:hypothetical protein